MTALQIEHIARSWVGTKFRLYGRSKATSFTEGACDCIGLIIGIAKELSLYSKAKILLSQFDHCNYYLQNNGLMLENFLDKHLEESELYLPSHIALLQLSPQLQHVGVLSDYSFNELGLIHADIRARKVVEHHFADYLRAKVVRLYKFHFESEDSSAKICSIR